LLTSTALFFAVILMLEAASGDVQKSVITIVATNCVADADVVPTLTAIRFSGSHAEIPLEATSRSLVFGVHELTTALPPGDWFIHVNGKGVGCGSDGQITVLPGLPRHIVFPRIGALILGPSCSVAGRLPVQGLSVRLVSAGGEDVPVAVDGTAYYSQEFGRGKYTLEIGMMQEAQVDIPLDYSDRQAGEFCDKKIVRDITLDDLGTATTH